MSAVLQTLFGVALLCTLVVGILWLIIAGMIGCNDCNHPDAADDFDQHTDQALALLDEPYAVWGPADELALRRWQKEHQ